jgi:hypothetical protein
MPLTPDLDLFSGHLGLHSLPEEAGVADQDRNLDAPIDGSRRRSDHATDRTGD